MKSINIKYPFEDNTNTNEFFKTNIISKDSYSSNLMLLLLTQKGERLYNSDYGTNLLKYIFEPNDDITTIDIEKDLRETVSKYMSEIEITNVTFDFDGDEENEISDNQLNINVEFIYRANSFSEEGSISLKIQGE